MLNPTYLALSRNQIFYFRWPIPRHTHPARKPSTIKVSLRTRDPREALRLARYLGYAAHGVVVHGTMHGMQYQDIRNTLHQHMHGLHSACTGSSDIRSDYQVYSHGGAL
ncbi:DUF6538 domain-containing protein [Mesorhizobium sp. M0684]|uniref:DUF6538 domain-containing protein n=1 Tax=unclassified Mesorhizobium TaxID=325217 RepID=UPI003338F2F8